MSRFSGGVWEYAQTGEDGYTIYAMEAWKVERAIAEVLTGSYRDSSREAAANARLMSFAPDMFKYLVQVLNEYDLEPDLEGDIMLLIEDINGGQL